MDLAPIVCARAEIGANSAEQDILQHSQPRHAAELLFDYSYARCLNLSGVRQCDRRPVDQDLALIGAVAILDVDDLVLGIFVEHGFEAVHAHGHFRLNLSAGDDEDIRRRAVFLLEALDKVGRGELTQLPMVIFD